MQDFRNLKVWQRAHRLTLALYRFTKKFPKEELYGLTAQIRRAACSICANIAEGCGRRGDKEFGRFLHISLGSACELEYHLLLSADLEYLDRRAYIGLNREVVEVKRMISGLLVKLRADS
jgi:four helix bundle protein